MLMMKNLNSFQNISNKIQTSFTSAELRINKDLLEMKNFRITTNSFDVKYSNILKDYLKNKYSMLVSMESIETKEVYEVFISLILKFCILFNADYPFSPPEMKSSDSNFSLNLNILTNKNWSPVLSINSILFALELMLLDPELESKMNFKDFLFTQQYNQESYYKFNSKNENITYTNSPKIIYNNVLNNSILSHSNLKKTKISCYKNPYYIRKKRLFCELENLNNFPVLDSLCLKKFKYSKDSYDTWRITSN